MDVVIFKELVLFLRCENMVILRILHYTEAATDHQLCYYYYITMEELENSETDKRLVLWDQWCQFSGKSARFGGFYFYLAENFCIWRTADFLADLYASVGGFFSNSRIYKKYFTMKY